MHICMKKEKAEKEEGRGKRRGCSQWISHRWKGLGLEHAGVCWWSLPLLGSPSTVELSSEGQLRRDGWERLPSGRGRVWRTTVSSGNGGSYVAAVKDSLHILPIYHLLISYLSCMHIYRCLYAMLCTWKSENNSLEGLL